MREERIQLETFQAGGNLISKTEREERIQLGKFSREKFNRQETGEHILLVEFEPDYIL